jgi:hypothetical protein
MCCWLAVFALLGPRALAILLWLFRPVYFNTVFSSFIWPFLGIIFAPWTTVSYIFVGTGGITGIWEWLLIGLGVFADIATYSGSAYGNKDKIPGMS